MFATLLKRLFMDIPLGLISRPTLEHALSASALDALFD